MERIDYVLGFLFDDKKERVVLIEKNRPSWQAGLLNGVGGKIELGEETTWGLKWKEKPQDAMRREFKEETGVDIPLWVFNGTMSGDGFCVWVYSSFGPVDAVQTMEDEKVAIYNVDTLLRSDKVIPNLKWMIPFAIHDIECTFEVRY
jgi:8-oxo-dGTP diphosphatase